MRRTNSTALSGVLALTLLVAMSVSVSADEGQANAVATETPPPGEGCERSLQSLIDDAVPGTTLYVPSCIYRETVTLSKPLTLAGRRGAEIRGSDVWTTWIASGSTWLSQQTVPTLPVTTTDPNACDAGSDNCLWPQQVFADGVALTGVHSGDPPVAGQFALDADFHVILATNPNGHLVEVTTRPRWLITASDGITIRGMIMRHAGNSALVGAVSNDGYSDWTLQDSIVSDAHAANISLDGGSNVRALRNDASAAGLVGISATDITEGGLVQGNHLHHNRTRDAAFNRSWGAAGLKLTRVQSFLVDANEADHNDAAGLWCDIDCSDVTISNNRVHHNQWQGINFEISNGASIHDNSLWENGWGFQSWGWGAGIVVSSSANAEVYNNVTAWNYAGISVIWQNRPDSPGPNPVGNYVHDNAIMKKIVTGDFAQTFWQNLSLAWLSDGTAPLYDPSSNNRSATNWIWYDKPENQSVRFAWTTQYFNLAQFADTRGGNGTHYLTTAESEQMLTDRNMPLAKES